MDAPSCDTIGEVVTLADTIVWNILNDQTDIGTKKLILDQLGKSLLHSGNILAKLCNIGTGQEQVLGSL
tara:strand:- start:329 stop:535 length:207 start_codon:yes stop_codon:yes gene_type:complete